MNLSIFNLDNPVTLQIWSSGYDARFTRERSRVRPPVSVISCTFFDHASNQFILSIKSKKSLASLTSYSIPLDIPFSLIVIFFSDKS